MIWRKHNRREGTAFNTEKVFLAATQPLKTVYAYFQTSCRGLTDEEIKERQKEYGQNEIVHEQAQKAVVMFCKAFINPFIGVLMALAIVSLVIDVWMAAPEEREWTSVVVISTMVLLSVVLRFSQEWKSSRASDALKKMVKNTASVYRNGREESEEVNITELVPGDVSLSFGPLSISYIPVIE